MKKIAIVVLLLSITLLSFARRVTITASEDNAEVFVDGSKIGNAPISVPIQNGSCINVEIKKTGFLAEKRKYCNSANGFPECPTKDYISLIRDEAYDATIVSDLANVDFNVAVNKKFNEQEAWRIVGEIVTNYIDDIQENSRETGYLKTAWKVQKLGSKIIRTRIIVKPGNNNPLGYKIKISSEYCDDLNASFKDDEKFKEWDRILKKYKELINEFQTRLGN